MNRAAIILATALLASALPAAPGQAADDCQKQVAAALGKLQNSGPVRLTDQLIILGKVSSEAITEFAPPNRFRYSVNVPGLANMPEYKWTRIGSEVHMPGLPVETQSVADDSTAGK